MCKELERNRKHGDYDLFDQLFALKYRPGATLAAHCDERHAFGGVLAGVSLLADTTMTFSPDVSHASKSSHTSSTSSSSSSSSSSSTEIPISIPRRSVYFMTTAARYDWMHEIKRCDAVAPESDARITTSGDMTSDIGDSTAGGEIEDDGGGSERISLTFRTCTTRPKNKPLVKRHHRYDACLPTAQKTIGDMFARAPVKKRKRQLVRP
jgi:hypothetical protein